MKKLLDVFFKLERINKKKENLRNNINSFMSCFKLLNSPSEFVSFLQMEHKKTFWLREKNRNTKNFKRKQKTFVVV